MARTALLSLLSLGVPFGLGPERQLDPATESDWNALPR